MTTSKPCQHYNMSSRVLQEQSNRQKTKLNSDILPIQRREIYEICPIHCKPHLDTLPVDINWGTIGQMAEPHIWVNVHPVNHIIHNRLEHVIWKHEWFSLARPVTRRSGLGLRNKLCCIVWGLLDLTTSNHNLRKPGTVDTDILIPSNNRR